MKKNKSFRKLVLKFLKKNKKSKFQNVSFEKNKKKSFKLLVLEFLKKTKKKFQIVSFGVS